MSKKELKKNWSIFQMKKCNKLLFNFCKVCAVYIHYALEIISQEMALFCMAFVKVLLVPLWFISDISVMKVIFWYWFELFPCKFEALKLQSCERYFGLSLEFLAFKVRYFFRQFVMALI